MADDSKPNRILVVEDELYVQGMLEDFLRRYGYEVSVVPTAEKAFESLQEENIDLVLLDKNLPDMSGVEVLSQLRFNNPELPVIFMTGYPSERSKLMVRHLGISAYFEKPVNLKVLASAIAEALGEGPSGAETDSATAGEPPSQSASILVESIDEASSRLTSQETDSAPDDSSGSGGKPPQVVLVCSAPTVAQKLAGATSEEIRTIAAATDPDPVYDFLQSHRVYVLAVDFTMPGGAALALSRWAAQKDPTMSLLALVGGPTVSADVKRLSESMNIRYSVTIPIEDPSDLVGKLEILLKRTRTLRAFRQAVS